MAYKLTTRKSWSETLMDLRVTFSRWGIDFGDWDVKKPRSGSEVTLTYKKNGRAITLTYNKQDYAEDNLRAIYLALEDMRMIEVREVGDIVQSAYKQISDGSERAITLESAYQVLGITENAELEVAEAAYKTLARKYHPDNKTTGSSATMNRINLAINQIRNLKGGEQ